MPCHRRAVVALFAFSLSLAAESAVALKFRLLDPAGNPVAERKVRVQVEIASPDGRSATRDEAITTDAHGGMSVSVDADARYRLTITCEGIGYAVHGPRFAPNQETEKISPIRLTRTGCVLGRVVDKDTGHPVPRAGVGANPSDPREEPYAGKSVKAEADGTFVVPDLAPGKWRFWANAPGRLGASAEIVVTGGDYVQRMTIEMERGVRIAGRVLLSNGETPAAGAAVGTGRRQDAKPVDGDGRFALENQGPGQHRLRVWHDDFARHDVTLNVEKGVTPPPLTVILKSRGGSMGGVVRDADRGNAPMPGALVAATLASEAGYWLGSDGLVNTRLQQFEDSGWFGADTRTTRTDEAGRYRLDRLGAGEYAVFAFRPDGPGARREGVRVAEGQTVEGADIALTERPAGFLLLKFVDENGRPLADQSVTIRYECGRLGGSSSRHLDKSGSFYLKVGEKGTYDLTAQAAGRKEVRRQAALDPRQPAGPETFVMLPGAVQEEARGALAGHIFMPDGRTPAAGINVFPCAPKEAPFPESDTSSGDWRAASRLSVAAGEDGAFRIAGLRPGRYAVFVTPRRQLFHSSELVRPELGECLAVLSEVVEIKPGQETGGLRIVLEKAGVIAGRLLDADTGGPLADGNVNAHTSRSGDQAGATPFETAHSPSARSAPDGTYRLESLRPGTYRLFAHRADYEAASREEVSVKAGEEISVDLGLRRVLYGEITGTVLLPDGAPAAGAEVYRYGIQRQADAMSDGEGRFGLTKVRAGPATVYVRKDGWAPASVETTVRSGKTPEVAVALRRGGTVECLVLKEAGGAPVPGARVWLWPRARHGFHASLLEHGPGRMADVAVGEADAEGRCRMEHVPEGPFVALVIEGKDVCNFLDDVRVPDGETVRLALTTVRPRCTLRVRARRADGTAVAGARVEALGRVTASRPRNIKTDDNGEWTREDLLPGPHAVICVQGEETETLIQTGVVLSPEAPASVEFVFGPTGGLAGRVVDAAGRPVSGAWVSTFDERTLYDFEGPPRQFGFARCQTDEAGLFHLKKIQAGVYTLYVAPSGPLARRGATQAPGLLLESGKETRAGDIVLAE